MGIKTSKEIESLVKRGKCCFKEGHFKGKEEECAKICWKIGEGKGWWGGGAGGSKC
jgi:hypothetical protein